MYFQNFFLWCFKNSFNVIKLAKDEIIIPNDPIFTEINNSLYSCVNLDKNIAVGTLLINWHDIIPAIRVFLSTIFDINSFIIEILAIFPENIKNTKNVANNA